MTTKNAWKHLLWVAVITLAIFQLADATTFLISADKTNNIQNTINKANDGDRIIIKSGVYRGNVNVTKSVILIGLDTGKGWPILNAGQKESAITIFANGVWLEGFDLINSGNSNGDAGIKILSNNNIIKGNVMTNNSNGIYLDKAKNNSITNNLAMRNGIGLSISKSQNNRIFGNTARNNTFAGVFLAESRTNKVVGNLVLQNSWVGILLSNSSDNNLEGNYAEGNSDEGIWLLNSQRNTIRSNSAINNRIFGILLVRSSNNTIANNRATNNLDGLSLESSANNVIQLNEISSNAYGLYVDKSSNNSIYLNNFLNNSDNVHSYGSFNQWNSSKFLAYQYKGIISWGYLGNFWNDYLAADRAGTGVGTWPYSRDSVVDAHPLISEAKNYHLLV